MPRPYDYAPELTVERARELRQRLTRAEALLWQALRRKPWGIKFRRQHPIGPFIMDFYCAEARLGIEIDGGLPKDTTVTPHRIVMAISELLPD